MREQIGRGGQPLPAPSTPIRRHSTSTLDSLGTTAAAAQLIPEPHPAPSSSGTEIRSRAPPGRFVHGALVAPALVFRVGVEVRGRAHAVVEMELGHESRIGLGGGVGLVD